MADYNTVRVDQSGGVVTLTLNKPDKMNAMGPEMVAEMMSVFDALPGMEARALLITGEGRGFSSGADLSGRSLGGGGSKPGDASRRSLQTSFNPLMLALAGLDVPVVTAVNGAAAGIGCTLALSGDLIVAGWCPMAARPGCCPRRRASRRRWKQCCWASVFQPSAPTSWA